METLENSHVTIERSRAATATPGLTHWMQRVLEECGRVNADFGADAVHDLRVALRRCRSMADGLKVFDPSPSWKEMKRAGRKLFRSLGALRDTQVMSQWVHQLTPEDDPETRALLDLLAQEESQQKRVAAEALHEFNTRQWRKWSRELPTRARRVKVGSPVFQHLALERWTEAHNLHRQALRNRSQVSFHRLRIGIKRFRYIVENFVPQQHEAWSSDLKELQDLLGDVHDLDVLWETARRVNAFGSAGSRNRWQGIVQRERGRRIARYRERMVGSQSLWPLWRADLPQGEKIQFAAMTRFRIWASFIDPEVPHSQHVAMLSRQIFDGLAPLGLPWPTCHPNARAILVTAALLHAVGLAKHDQGSHKTSSRLIRKLTPPLGWSQEDLLTLAAVVRFHRGALPHAQHKSLQGLAPVQRPLTKLLAGILRIAEALDDARDGQVRRLRVEYENGVVLISAAGYLPMTQMGQDVAAARHLLEIVLRKPILVKPLKVPADGR